MSFRMLISSQPDDEHGAARSTTGCHIPRVGPLFTIGHSTRSFEELVAACAPRGVACIADVRRFPGSRRNPQFGRTALEQALPAQGIRYCWIPKLGGRRNRGRDAPPSPWRVPAFAGYAEHMGSVEFRAGWDELCVAMAGATTAIMCAEASPYSCHRRLIADWAVLHGIEVVHILDERRQQPHQVTPFARRAGDGVVYEMTGQLDLPLG
jgi:uncharacterized protein (DUF488 family)